jgi:hypothetical protein
MKIQTTAAEMLANQLEEDMIVGDLTDDDRRNLLLEAVAMIAVVQADPEELQRQLDAIDEPTEQAVVDAQYSTTQRFVWCRHAAIMKQLGITSDMMPDWYNKETT